jgi:hypothetical protein
MNPHAETLLMPIDPNIFNHEEERKIFLGALVIINLEI